MEPLPRRAPPPPPPVEDEHDEIAVSSSQPLTPSSATDAQTQQAEPPATGAQPNVADIIAPEQDAAAAPAEEEPHEAQEPAAAKEEPEQQTEEDAQPIDVLYPAGLNVDDRPDAELQPMQSAQESEPSVEKLHTAAVPELTMETTASIAARDPTPELTEVLAQETSVAIPDAAEETRVLQPSAFEQSNVLDQVTEMNADDEIAQAVASDEALLVCAQEATEAIDAQEMVAQEFVIDADVELVALNEVARTIAEEIIAQALESFEVLAEEVADVMETKKAEVAVAVATEESASAIEAQAEEPEAVAIEEQHEEIVDVAEKEPTSTDQANPVAAIEDHESPETAVPSEETRTEDQKDLTAQKIEKSPQESLDVVEESATESFEIHMATESSAAAESHATKASMADMAESAASACTIGQDSSSIQERTIEVKEHEESTESVVIAEDSVTTDDNVPTVETDGKTEQETLIEEPESTSFMPNDAELSADVVVTEPVATDAEPEVADAGEENSAPVVLEAESTERSIKETQSSDSGSPSKQDNEDALTKSPPATTSGRTFKKAVNGVRSLVSRFEVGKADQSPDKLKYRTVDSFFSHDEERSIRVREERQKLETQSPDKPKFRTVDSFFSHDEERSIRVREEKLKLEALAEQKRLEALAATERALKEEQARLAEQEQAESNQPIEEMASIESKNEALATEEAAPEDEITDEAAEDDDDEVEDNQLQIDTETNQQEEKSADNKPSTSPSMGDVASRLRKVKSIVRRFESPRRQESLSTLQIRTVRDYFPSASKRNIHVDDEKRRFELMAEQQRLDALAAAAEANHGEYTRFASPRKDLGPGSPKSEPHTPQKVFSTPTKKPAMPMINDEDKESSSSGEEEDTAAQQETASSSLKVKNLASRFESPRKDESLDKLSFRTVRTFFSEAESPSIRVGAEKEKFDALVKQRALEAEQRLLASPAKLKFDAHVDGHEESESAVDTNAATESVSTVTEDAQLSAERSTESVSSTEKTEEGTESSVSEINDSEQTTMMTKIITTTTVTVEEITSDSSAQELVDTSPSSSVAPVSVAAVTTTLTHETVFTPVDVHTQHAVAHVATGEVMEPQPIISSKHLHKYVAQEIALEHGSLSPVLQKAALYDDVLEHSQSLRTVELTFLMKLMKRNHPRKLSHSKTWNGVFCSPMQQTPP